MLTPLETADAQAQGWSLNHVYDLATEKWRVMVLGMPSAELAGQFVVNQARMGNPLAQKALRFVMESNQRG